MRAPTAALPSVPKLEAPAPQSSPVPSRPRVDAPLDGVMMSGSVSSQRRPAPPPGLYAPPTEVPTQDQAMKLIIAIGVVGLVPIIVTAILMTVAYAPEGWNVVAFLMKPEQPISLIVQGALAAVAFGSAGALMRGAFKRWRGEIDGGPLVSICYACIAVGLLFATMQFARAAF